ncbi:MFS transporter [Georgenia yuyongxinii]|uniref:MFS transporter n=1 Tax=Georgenia yuyongxinii TaxID=2589797 RepID=A0A5B8CBT3_9MICO|nr:MFS transporter [Georgenia yuyongxinii]QDC25636.1 MFS transporter [Georgenia yuyongxinii]
MTSAEVPPGAYRGLAALGLAMLLGMATWFSASAVVPQLSVQYDLSSGASAWLTIGVQVGFVIGAVLLALTSAADRFGPRQLMAAGAALAGAANLGLLVVETGAGAIGVRLLTGACLAGVYPPAMKAIATWFRASRATALAVLIGALTLGSASPHLAAAAGGLDWRFVVVASSVLSALGAATAFLVASDGPFPFPRTTFRLGDALRAFSDRRVLLTSLGYFGHMWELYAMWAWFGVFFGSVLAAGGTPETGRLGSLVTFVVIGIGAIGCWFGGRLAERIGSARTAIISMLISGSCALLIGWLAGGPVWLVVVVALVWGFWVIPDSAQFSALITQVADQRYVGSMLTLQMACGYIVTVPIVWLTPLLQESSGWGWTFTVLALGPAVGALAIRALVRVGTGDDSEPAVKGLTG